MLAIVIPYYKLTFFEETLESLAIQSDKRFKVYIGDDASPENPTGLLKNYNGQFDFIYHRFENNLGIASLSKQWERCIELSGNEEWLMILGDDDVLGANVVEEFYKHYNVFAEKTNIVRFATVSQNYNTSEISEIFKHPDWEQASESYFRRFKKETRSSLSEYVFKRLIYNKIKFYNFPLAWHSDDWAWLEFSERKPIFSINNSVISIGFSQFSLSGTDDNYELKNQASLQFYRKIIEEKLIFFSKEQALALLMKYEVLVKKHRNLTVEECCLLLEKYCVNFKLVDFLKLLRRVIYSISK